MAVMEALPKILNKNVSEFYDAPLNKIENGLKAPLANKFLFSSLFDSSLPFSPSQTQTGSHLLARRCQSYTSSLTAGQMKLDQWMSDVAKQIQNPMNIALFATGAYFLKTAQLGIQFEEVAQVSKNIFLSVSGKWKVGGLAVSALFATACGEGPYGSDSQFRRDGGAPDFGQDGGVGVDNDKDGVPSGIDCDDSNPHVFPLTPAVAKDGVVEIRESTTICPGLYDGYTLLVPAKTKDIILTGKDVTLKGSKSNGGQDSSVGAQAIRVIDSDNIQVLGFNIQDYNEPVSAPGVVRIENSRKIELNTLDITVKGGSWPLRLVSSDDTTVKVNTHTHSNKAIQAENCKRTKVTGCNFNSEQPYDYLTAEALAYFNGGSDNTLLSCQLYMGQGSGLLVKDSPNFQGIENIIHGNTRTGIYLDNASAGYYRNNKVNDNGKGAQGPSDIGFGLYLQRGSKSNTFYQNDFTGNAPAPYGVRDVDASLKDNNFSENNPQP